MTWHTQSGLGGLLLGRAKELLRAVPFRPDLVMASPLKKERIFLEIWFEGGVFFFTQ